MLGGEEVRQYNVLVSAVTFHEMPSQGDCVLLLRRGMSEKFLPGAWGLPCGKIEHGEDLEIGVLRELREEAGISGDVEKMTGVSWFESSYQEHPLENLQINFAVRAHDQAVRLGRSHDRFAWLAISQLKYAPVPVDQFTMRAIRQALDERIML
jgi:8-oxo-dGTP diphosphatase